MTSKARGAGCSNLTVQIGPCLTTSWRVCRQVLASGVPGWREHPRSDLKMPSDLDHVDIQGLVGFRFLILSYLSLSLLILFAANTLSCSLLGYKAFHPLS